MSDDKAASPVLSALAGLREMVDVARKEGYESITLTDLEHAIDLAEDRAFAPPGGRDLCPDCRTEQVNTELSS